MPLPPGRGGVRSQHDFFGGQSAVVQNAAGGTTTCHGVQQL